MAEEHKLYDLLLMEYRTIWNNRHLAEEDKSSEEILKDAIKRELLDENSHPRIRKNRFEKYYSAVKRVISSNVSSESKVRLVEVHNQVMEEISRI